jgi:hypothetical protein
MKTSGADVDLAPILRRLCTPAAESAELTWQGREDIDDERATAVVPAGRASTTRPLAAWGVYLWYWRARQGRVKVDQIGKTSSHAPTSAAPPFAQLRVGRLIEVRPPQGLVSLVEVEAFVADVLAAMRQAGGRALLCSDYRGASPLLPEVTGPWAHAMRKSNEYLLRSAVLVDPANTMFNLQIERVVRCADDRGLRRIFTDRGRLGEWMSEAATDAERRAIDAFLSRLTP